MKENNIEKDPRPFTPFQLTSRQIEVLRLMCNDKTNTEIAETLSVSIRTVETFKTQILKSVGAKNMATVVMLAVRKGYI